ncbi:MAG: AIM24 family protein [Myxococcaceae bacterium]
MTTDLTTTGPGALTPEAGPNWRIEGEISQVLRITPERAHPIWAQKGSLVAYSEGIEWDLKIPGGLGAGVSRMLGGEGLSLTFIRATRPGLEVSLASNQPGKIAVWDLTQGPLICTSGSFLAAVGEVEIQVTVARRAGAAFFGGAGLLLQRISGRGHVFVQGAGDFLHYDLAPGQRLLVSSGNLAAFSEQVDYGIRGVGGLLKIFFGKEGLFMTELKGPGRVMVQSLKRSRMRGQMPQ